MLTVAFFGRFPCSLSLGSLIKVGLRTMILFRLQILKAEPYEQESVNRRKESKMKVCYGWVIIERKWDTIPLRSLLRTWECTLAC